MEIKKIKNKQLCPHKLARLSLERALSTSRNSSRQHKHPSTTHKKVARTELQKENDKLRAQNYIFQQYFATFECKFKDQRRQNQRLRERVQELSKQRDGAISQRKTQTTCILSERTGGHKLSRATKQSRRTLPNEYI